MNYNKYIEQTVLKSPANFAVHFSNGNWLAEKHLKYINSKLIKVFKCNDNKRFLMLNMPPRHGKSEFISKYLPAWFLVNNPDKKIILTAYEATFAASWGRKVRELIDFAGSNFNIRIDKNARSVSDFLIEDYGGSMSCVGAGGSITGKGADLIIIDDPIKNDSEANSELIRDNIWDWFRSTVYTRLEPNGIIILIMTRWHHDDLCGRILDSESDNKWEYIVMPAFAKSDDILSRDLNEPLWADRFSFDKLTEIKKTIGSYWFNALYQQEPSPDSGGIFKRKDFRYFKVSGKSIIVNSIAYHKDKIPLYCTIDLAATKNEMSDYTVIITYGITKDNQILIFDILREKFDSSEHYNLVINHFYKWNPVLIGIESVQYQISLVSSLSKAGLPIKNLKASKDKVSRALGIAAKMENEEVFFKNNADWLGDFEKELIEFPTGKYDDQVDAFAYIMQILPNSSKLLPATKSKKSIVSNFQKL